MWKVPGEGKYYFWFSFFLRRFSKLLFRPFKIAAASLWGHFSVGKEPQGSGQFYLTTFRMSKPLRFQYIIIIVENTRFSTYTNGNPGECDSPLLEHPKDVIPDKSPYAGTRSGIQD
jgi:hypothetical protein